MPVQIHCSRCEYRGIVPDELDGTQVSCPQCSMACQVQGVKENIRAVSSPEGTKRCPYCGERVKNSAIKCRYCDEILNNELQYLKGVSRKLSRSEDLEQLTLRRAHRRARNALILSVIALLTAFFPAYSTLDLSFDAFSRKEVLSWLFTVLYSGSSAGVFLLSFGARGEFHSMESPEPPMIRFAIGVGVLSVILGLFFLLYLNLYGRPVFGT